MKQILCIKKSITDSCELMFLGEGQDYECVSNVEIDTVDFDCSEDWHQNFLNNFSADDMDKIFPSIYYLQFAKDLKETNRRLEKIISKYEI